MERNTKQANCQSCRRYHVTVIFRQRILGSSKYSSKSTVKTASTMDESQSLDALANVLNELAEKPLDISLHAKHIHLAQSLEGMDSEVHSAMEMFSNFYAAGEDVWLALIKAKANTVDLETANGVGELLALYARAEADYLCTPYFHLH